jgi:hypothetical protein
MVVALAGRRIDNKETDTPSFPLSNAAKVKVKIASVLKYLRAGTLICSGANGADLLALEAAAELKMARYMILPFEPNHFKRLSVTDRPGDWEKIFDRVYEGLIYENGTIVLGFDAEDKLAFKRQTWQYWIRQTG